MLIKTNNMSHFLKKIKIIKLVKNNKNYIIKILQFIKFISLSFFYVKNHSYDNEMKINIIEAILYDIYKNKNYYNVIFGSNLIILLPIMKRFNNMGIKLWIILYCIWNFKVFNNRRNHMSHIIPTLYTSLLSFGFDSNEIFNNFCLMRSISIRTYILQDILYNKN